MTTQHQCPNATTLQSEKAVCLRLRSHLSTGPASLPQKAHIFGELALVISLTARCLLAQTRNAPQKEVTTPARKVNLIGITVSVTGPTSELESGAHIEMSPSITRAS